MNRIMDLLGIKICIPCRHLNKSVSEPFRQGFILLNLVPGLQKLAITLNSVLLGPQRRVLEWLIQKDYLYGNHLKTTKARSMDGSAPQIGSWENVYGHNMEYGIRVQENF